MKQLVLGLFLSLMAGAPAMAMNCVPPASSCKAMTCECGVCGACSKGKEKKACEARAAAQDAEMKEYLACMNNHDSPQNKVDMGDHDQDQDAGHDGDED